MALVPAAASTPDPTVVRTDDGLVRGRADGDHLLFQSIPFAAPPVGNLRYRAPRPPETWDGVRDATRPPQICAQWYTQGEETTFTGDEDCLYLNVSVPRGGATNKPVLVFVHGGGLIFGNPPSYDPRRITRQGDVIVVTIAYRLGALGLLHHPALRDPMSGNFTLADQQAALRWVRANAGAFGGDPRNVTLWGESGGGRAVCAHLAAPGSRGLFDKAVVTSAPCGEYLTSTEAAGRGADAAEAVGCGDARDVAACLRAVPARELADLGWRDARISRRQTDLPWGPVTGTAALPLQPIDAARRGLTADVPTLLTTTSEEMRSFVLSRLSEGAGRLDEAGYSSVVGELYGPDAARVLAAYPAARYPSPDDALATLMTDEGKGLGTCVQLDFADAHRRHAPVHYLEYAVPTDAPGLAGFAQGARHGADIQELFDSFWNEPSEPTDTSRRLTAYLTRFAWHATPGFAPYWRGRTQQLTPDGAHPVNLARDHRCAFWATVR